MKKIETLFLLLCLTSLVYRMSAGFGEPSDNFFAISFTLLSIFYAVLGFAFFNGIKLRKLFLKESYRSIIMWKIFVGIGIGFCLFIASHGFSWPILAIPGGEFMLITGLIISVSLTVILLIAHYLNRSSGKLFILKRTIFSTICLATMFAIPLEDRISFLYKDLPEFADAYIEYYTNPDNMSHSDIKEINRKYRDL